LNNGHTVSWLNLRSCRNSPQSGFGAGKPQLASATNDTNAQKESAIRSWANLKTSSFKQPSSSRGSVRRSDAGSRRLPAPPTTRMHRTNLPFEVGQIERPHLSSSRRAREGASDGLMQEATACLLHQRHDCTERICHSKLGKLKDLVF